MDLTKEQVSRIRFLKAQGYSLDQVKKIVDREKVSSPSRGIASEPTRAPASELTDQEINLLKKWKSEGKSKDEASALLSQYRNKDAPKEEQGLLDWAAEKVMVGARAAKEGAISGAEYLGAVDKRGDISMETAPLALARAGMNLADTPTGITRQALYSKKSLPEILKKDFTREGIQAALSQGFPSSEQYITELNPEDLSALGQGIQGLYEKSGEYAMVPEGQQMDTSQALAKAFQVALPLASDVLAGPTGATLGLGAASKVAGKFGKAGLSKGLAKGARIADLLDPASAVGAAGEFVGKGVYRMPFRLGGYDKNITDSVKNAWRPSDVMWDKGNAFLTTKSLGNYVKKADDLYQAALTRIRNSGVKISAKEQEDLAASVYEEVFGKHSGAYGEGAIHSEQSGAYKAFREKFITKSMQAAEDASATKVAAEAKYLADIEAHKKNVMQTEAARASAQPRDFSQLLEEGSPQVMPPSAPNVQIPAVSEEEITDFVNKWNVEKGLVPKKSFLDVLRPSKEAQTDKLMRVGSTARKKIIDSKDASLIPLGKEQQSLMSLKELLRAKEPSPMNIGQQITGAAASATNPYLSGIRAVNRSRMGNLVRSGAANVTTGIPAAFKKLRMANKPLFDQLLNQIALGEISSAAAKDYVDLPERGLYFMSNRYLSDKAKADKGVPLNEIDEAYAYNPVDDEPAEEEDTRKPPAAVKYFTKPKKGN